MAKNSLVFGHSPWKARVRQVLTAALLARLALTRTPVVRTVHNLELPSPMTRVQAALLRAFDGLTVLRIRINPTTPIAPGLAFETILHGHYREWFAPYPTPERVPGRLGYFGLIRRYKRVESLLEAFAEAPAAWSLRAGGGPSLGS